jgi:hypothetical protein
MSHSSGPSEVPNQPRPAEVYFFHAKPKSVRCLTHMALVRGELEPRSPESDGQQ